MNGFTAHDETGLPSHPTEEPREQPLASLSDIERRHIERVLEKVRWNQRHAARILGISRWSLARRLHKYGMHRPGREQHA
jgi:DNA-binding NtrC family response regulator